ncbi:50S ribosomal protein L22 [Candidatus Woesearchaeota archaeon]|nr:50S ribosomal protein L22 [Candidatus Woesearchaeota archaeon]
MTSKINQSINNEKIHYASVSSWNIPISRKFSVEIGNFVKNKELKKAKVLLENVIAQKAAVPFKRYNRDLGHKRGIASGRYPIKASKLILKLLDSLEANAENKGIDTNNLIIKEFIANKGNKMWHQGRKRRRKMKRCHIFIKAIEKEVKK